MEKTNEKNNQLNTMRDADLQIAGVVRKNLKKLMEYNCINVSNFCNHLLENDALAPHRTTFGRFMNSHTHTISSVAFLLACCECFGLSLDTLLSENFDPSEHSQIFTNKYAHLLKCQQHTPELTTLPSTLWSASEIFVDNPKSPILKPYLQTYHCYYYSTVSSENKTQDTKDAILHGTLKLEPDGEHCTATLSIDTKKKNAQGNPVYKVYTGNVVVCPSIQSIYCILVLAEGEFCFLCFRYSHLNYFSQQCRIAEVLSTSSTMEKRYPIVHRMLLSNQPIADEDLNIIAPHLWLNNSQITIGESGLLSLKECHPLYDDIINELLDMDGEYAYQLKESQVIDIAKKSLSEQEIPLFLTNMRLHSHATRYNKVSPKADTNLRNILVQLGYFKE